MKNGWFCSNSAARATLATQVKLFVLSVVLLPALMSGCRIASDPEVIRPDYISPEEYRDLDCRELAMRIVMLGYQIEDLHQRLSKRRERDQWQLAFVWFYGISGAFIDGDGEEAATFRHLQGEFEAARIQAVRKDCGFEAPTREAIFLNAKSSLSATGGDGAPNR